MKRIIPGLVFVSLLIVFSGCPKKHAVIDKKPEKVTVEKKEKKPVKMSTGWQNPDTYVVKAQGKTEKEAIKNAKHTILKDIVNVRVRKQSKYLDISKIQMEFKKPLENGKVLQKFDHEDGIIIQFQITDRGLKKKFERK